MPISAGGRVVIGGAPQMAMRDRCAYDARPEA